MFLKREDSWIKKDEKDFPVSQETLNSAVNNLATLDAEQELKDPQKLEEYDLDKPQNKITLTEKDGSETALQIGMKNENTGQYYVKKESGDNSIYLVAADALDPFMGNSMYLLRQKLFQQ